MALYHMDFVATIPTAPIKKQIIGNANREVGVTEEPLSVLAAELPSSFLSEEVGFGETVSEAFYTGDLAKLWSSPRLLSALVKHPDALPAIKSVAASRGVKIEPVKVTDALRCLGITQDFLWDKNIETIEELLHNYASVDNDIIKQDISFAFLSKYGINLLSQQAS